MMIRPLLFAWMMGASILLPGCGGGGTDPPQASPALVPPPAPHFVDVTAASGINYEVRFSAVPSNVTDISTFTSGGAAAGDFDGDGDIDVFITRGDLGPNLLYENVGNLVFVDVAAAARLAYTRSATENFRHSGPIFADMDGDGDLDLFMGGIFGDPSLIFANGGDGTFADVTAGSGIDTLRAAQSISAAFGDYDLDGDLDLLIAHWGTVRSFSNPGDTEHLWRNDSDASGIRFTSVSELAGISPSILTIVDPYISEYVKEIGADWTLTPTFARIDDDLYPDILMVADYNKTQVFMNNGDGTFSNATNVSVITDDNGMGSAVGDYDNDGDLDWFVSSILANPGSIPLGPGLSERLPIGNRLYRNDNGVFTDVTSRAGVADGGWGWGACFVDFENDGDLDIYHTNGNYRIHLIWGDYRTDSSKAFVSDGQGRFENRAAELGLTDTEQGNAVVCADFDDDGDIDILQLHKASGRSATLWQNDRTTNNYLRVKLQGLPPNTEAAGARIVIRIGDRTQMREIAIGSNYASQNPTAQIFGLGSSASVDELTIEWPDGVASPAMTNVVANQALAIAHPSLP